MIAQKRSFQKSGSFSYSKKKRTDSADSIFFPVVVGIILLLAIGFLLLSNWKVNQRREQLNARIENLKEEIATLEQKKQELSGAISQSGNPEYVEREARERFQLKKPGEEVVVVLPPEKTEEKPQGERKSFWQRLKEKIGF